MARFSEKWRKAICQRVKTVRIEHFGEGHGAQKAMARALDIPYTTYRGYEVNRVNNEFLWNLARKFGIPLMWILVAPGEDTIKGEARKVMSQPLISIDPDVGVVQPGKYKTFRVADESMEPTIKKGAWVGVQERPFSKELNGKIVGLKKEDQILLRRILIKDKTMLAIADNPAFTKDTLLIHKKDVVGEVSWCWQKF